MLSLIRRTLLAMAIGLTVGAAPVLAETVSVAVAANFTEPAKEIATAFHKATGDEATLSFGPSGGFYTQIAHGAPFQVFLSADTERARKAEEDGFGVKGSSFVYATGRLVLYSTTPGLVDAKGAVLKAPNRFQKVAIADPAAAPYGHAAVETMTKLGLYDALKPKLVQGASISQAFQFVQSGAAEIGFVALSQVIAIPGGSRWIVPEALHTPIEQGAVLLKTGADSPAAKAFLQFMKGREAKAIIRRYGYDVR